MRILAIDTALGAASACVFDGEAGETLSRETVWLARGHDQTIVPLIDRVVAHGGGRAFARIAVTVGPASFTGIRVGISAARAIGLALGIPVVGVSTLAAYVAPTMLDWTDGLVAAAIDARHGRVYFAAYANGRPIVAPRIATVREALRAVGSGPLRLTGSAAAAVADEAKALGVPVDFAESLPAPDIAFVARLGLIADPRAAPPRPLYLKSPDAKLPEPTSVAV